MSDSDESDYDYEPSLTDEDDGDDDDDRESLVSDATSDDEECWNKRPIEDNSGAAGGESKRVKHE